MILLLSQGSYEPATETIHAWLDYLGAKSIRLNGEELSNSSRFSFTIDEGGKKFIDAKNLIKFNNISTIFFRRYATLSHLKFEYINDFQLRKKLRLHHIQEHCRLYEFLLTCFPNAISVTSFYQEKLLNKINVLFEAQNSGFIIPSTIITSSKRKLEAHLLKFGSCIVKPIDECDYFNTNNMEFKMLSTKIDDNTLELIPNNFFPSYIQQYIEKKYEIRTFYLNEQCYSMAIFSQGNENTNVDFRNYDTKNPNRTVPYKLPASIEKKITNIMVKLKLKTGSIDLIMSKKDEYVFLEINPNGQFGMVSYPCNYSLHKEVAKYLIKASS